jgi:hypothetical protein
MQITRRARQEALSYARWRTGIGRATREQECTQARALYARGDRGAAKGSGVDTAITKNDC